MSRIAIIARREVHAAFHARWFVLYAGLFLVAGVLLTTVGLSDPAVHGYRGFARGFAGLLHLAVLLVPMAALLVALGAVVDRRESGVLEYLLAQPISGAEVFAGTWLGVNAALLSTLVVGLGVTGVTAVARGAPAALVGGTFGMVLLLAMAFASIGLAISARAASRARALTMGVLIWLACTALGTLGVMFVAIRWGVPAWVLTGWSLLNPVEAFRIGVLTVLDPDLSLLGPVGARVVERFGAAGTVSLAVVSLVAWTGVGAAAGLRVMLRPRDEHD